MADNYLEKKMAEYAARPATRAPRPAPTLQRLLLRTRSCRGYDPSFVVRADQLRKIIAVNTLTPSSGNRQLLRFRPVLADEADCVLPHIRMGAALPDLHLPFPGTEPRAFVVICTTLPESPLIDIDAGIAAQSMLLQATEIGLSGLCIAAFDKARIRETLALPCEPLLVLAFGRGAERIELTEARAGDSLRYYRTAEGTHCVPKLGLEELLLPAEKPSKG